MKRLILFLLFFMLLISCSNTDTGNYDVKNPKIVDNISEDLVFTKRLDDTLILTENLNETLVDVVFYWNCQDTLLLIDSIGNKLVYVNDLLNENYVSLQIFEANRNEFKVRMKYEYDTVWKYGVIEKNDFIGAFYKGAEHNEPLKLFLKPGIQESAVIYKDYYGFLTVNYSEGDYVNVTTTIDGEKFSGWIKKENLCANNYSTCS